MVDLNPESQYDPRNLRKPKGSARSVYTRLVGYALQYKFRLAVSIFFAVVVAACFSSMIFCVGAAFKALYVDEQTAQEQAAGLLERVRGFNQGIERAIGWAPVEVDPERALDIVRDMRANRGRSLAILSAALITIAFVGGLARFVQEYFAGAVGASISIHLGEQMFANIISLPISFFEQRQTGEILARFTNDMFMVNRGLANTFIKLFREPIKIVVLLTLALAVDWQLTLTVLVVLPIVGYLIVRIGKKVKKAVRRSLQKIAAMASVAAETVSGIMIVKAYRMEDYENRRVNEELGKLRKYLVRMVKFDAAITPATEFLLVVGLVVFMLLANRQVESHQLDSGDLVILFGALAAMMDPFRKLSSVNNMIQTSVASAERVFEFIDMESDVLEAPDAVALPPLRESLRFENVHFSYDGKAKVLQGVHFEVRKGEMVALVGFSGAGKSTIVKLIPRFYDVTSGAVTIDGVDIRQATFESLRDQISMVTQETILFNETVRHNIAFGRDTYSMERVHQAAVAAHAAQFIDELSAKYDTHIGESGATLSGGQRQRLAIARAIIKDPTVLILDEATSSLDSESEQAIQKAVEEFIVGRTTIVIAHRLSTVQRADRILVVHEGRIVEEGTHRELIDKQGLYRRLYDTQFAATEE